MRICVVFINDMATSKIYTLTLHDALPILPATYQGTILRSKGNPILNLNPRSMVTHSMQGDKINAINAFNKMHLIGKESYSELSARIRSEEHTSELQSQ